MTEFTINDEELTALKGKVVIVTGVSSGIGLTTVEFLLSLGASVVGADINIPASPPASADFLFVQTNVGKWSELSALFKKAKAQHGHIDYVFANAGVGPRANYLVLESDADGELMEPSTETLDINLKSVLNTAVLAVHFMKEQAEGGSIVLMGSSTGLGPLRAADYSTAKHGVLGFGRGFGKAVTAAGLPIRINTLMPSWTSTNILPDVASIMKSVSHESQPTMVIARIAALLMVDKSRNGDVIFVSDGKYQEIEKSVLAPAYEKIKGDGPSDDEILRRIFGQAT